jgi:hypothetical protein
LINGRRRVQRAGLAGPPAGRRAIY